MSFRGASLAILAASVMGLGACADATKDQNAALYSQNQELSKQLEAQKAQNDMLQGDLKTARSAASAGGTTGSPTDGGLTPISEGDIVTAGGLKTGKTSAAPAIKAPGGSAKSATIELSSDVMFESSRSVLKPDAKKQLDKIASTLNTTYKSAHFRVEGHTDSTPFKKGSTMTNEKLGQNRAQAVVDYLVSKGVSKSRLTAVSKADKEPKSKTNAAANRRVDIVVLP